MSLGCYALVRPTSLQKPQQMQQEPVPRDQEKKKVLRDFFLLP